jgi:hypothetical protein
VPEEYRTVSLSKLSRPATSREFLEGPVEYRDVELADGQHLACVKRGLYLGWAAATSGGGGTSPVAVLVYESRYDHPGGLYVEVMAADRPSAEQFARRLTRAASAGTAYRGRVLSLEQDCYHALSVKFHRLPQVARGGIILPEALLQRIERQTIAFSRHADRLRAAGRHVKRGILLHGPPGTGKTLTAMYLAAQMPGRTVLLLTGGGVGTIEKSAALARMLAPATVILEDVDLIGTERGYQTIGANALLFELLNQLDGLAEDADVLFVLTTNRPDVLEPALAARPGRIDQAIEIPLPDAECRRRLLELYGRGLTLRLSDPGRVIERTEGVSAAFIRELLRKAAVFAAEEAAAAGGADGDGDGGAGGNGTLTVRDDHVEEALHELLWPAGC